MDQILLVKKIDVVLWFKIKDTFYLDLFIFIRY